MLTQIAFKRGPVELVEHGVKVIFRLFERIFLPLAFYADLLILGSVHTSHYLIDNGVGEKPFCKPLMCHRGHCGFYVSVTKILDKRYVGVN